MRYLTKYQEKKLKINKPLFNTFRVKYLGATNYQPDRIRFLWIDKEGVKHRIEIPRDFKISWYEQIELILKEISQLLNKEFNYIED